LGSCSYCHSSKTEEKRTQKKKKKFPFRKQYSNILAANCTPKVSDGGFGGAKTHHRERVTGDITGAEEVGPTEQVERVFFLVICSCQRNTKARNEGDCGRETKSEKEPPVDEVARDGFGWK
jgi:hypothetical protein